MKLTFLELQNSGVRDLSPLNGMPIEFLRCEATPVSDLSPLAGMPLQDLNVRDTSVTDLAPLKACPLNYLRCGEELVERHRELLASLASLEEINGKPAGEVLGGE
jgi:hypothetical protein